MLEAERLLVATGRRPNVEDFGLEQLGLTITKQGIEVDERLRAAEASGRSATSTASRCSRTWASTRPAWPRPIVAGREAQADHRAIPAVTFTDPQVASVGRTDGEGLVDSSWKVESTARSSTYERPKHPGFLKVFADPETAGARRRGRRRTGSR